MFLDVIIPVVLVITAGLLMSGFLMTQYGQACLIERKTTNPLTLHYLGVCKGAVKVAIVIILLTVVFVVALICIGG